MLANVLAIAVALGSFFFYMAAFFFPEVHRKNDFYWCFLGLFYALVLWVASSRITGSVLIAQTASVVLLGWMGWQTVVLRKATRPSTEQTEVSPDVAQKANRFGVGNILGLFKRKQAEPVVQTAELQTEAETQDTETEAETAPTSSEEAIQAIEESGAIPAQPNVDIVSGDSTTETPADTEFSEEAIQAIEESDAISAQPEIDITSSDTPKTEQSTTDEGEATQEPIAPEPPTPNMVEAAQPDEETGTLENVEEAVVEAAMPRRDDLEVDENTTVEEIAPEAELTPPAEANPEAKEELSEFPEKIEPGQSEDKEE